MNLSREAQLLCLLNLARLEGSPKEQAIALIARGIDWDRFASLAESNAVLVLSVHRLKALGVTPPASLATKVREFFPQCEARLHSARNLMSAMQKAGVDVILLKGSLLLSEIYDIPHYKKMNDIDILVRWDQVEQAVEVLKLAGFTGVGPLFGQDEISSKSHHTPPYVSSDLSCVIGLHWGIHSPVSVWRSDIEGIWDRKVSAQFLGVPAFRMSWEDNLLHLCIHLPFFKIGLRELADVYNLVLFARPAVNWDTFSQRVTKWRAADPVFRVLTLTHTLMPLDVPAKLLAKWKESTSSFSLKDTESRLKETDLILESRSVYIGKIEKAFAVFRLTQNRSEKRKAWLAMWILLFSTHEKERLKFLSRKKWNSDWDRLLSRGQVPFRIWSAMARDYGHFPLALVTLLNALIVIKDSLFQFSKDGVPIKDLPFKKVLEALE